MKIIKIVVALLMVMLLVPLVIAFLPFVGVWFFMVYCLLVTLGFIQEILERK